MLCPLVPLLVHDAQLSTKPERLSSLIYLDELKHKLNKHVSLRKGTVHPKINAYFCIKHSKNSTAMCLSKNITTLYFKIKQRPDERREACICFMDKSRAN